MKKTDWFYDNDRKEWWMVSVATNAEHIPVIKLGDRSPNKTVPVRVKGITLHGENKKLWPAILAVTGCLVMALAAVIWMLAAS